MAEAVKHSGRRRKGWLRRAAGWLLVTTGTALGAASVMMVWYHALWIGGTSATSVAVELRTGQAVLIFQDAGINGSVWLFGRETRPWKAWEWTYDHSNLASGSGSKGLVLEATVWPFALAALASGGWLLRLDRRAYRRFAAGRCVSCGYDTAGLAPQAPCPECGRRASL